MNYLVTGTGISKARQAIVALRQQILAGHLPPGTRLTLRPLAKELGISVGAVSEALRELAHEQIVDFEPGLGARVKRLDLETLRSHHVLRLALECEAIRRCTSRITDRQLSELDDLADQVDRLTDVEEDFPEARRTDVAFHLRVADLAGVPSLAAALRACHLVRLMVVDAPAISDAILIRNRTHNELAFAIRSRDPQVAEQAMREHCEYSLQLQMRTNFGTLGW